MLRKCANPQCQTQLRHLQQGKLFVVYSGSAITTASRIEYAWLCASCCRSMTVPNGREVVVGKVQCDRIAVA